MHNIAFNPKLQNLGLNLVFPSQTEAESQPSDAQRKLLAAAKLLADATARMVEAARQCASSPQVSTITNSCISKRVC
jgi:hypothetical protein